MQAIADAANVNKALLHYYFRDKESLYEEVFSYTVKRFMASLSEPLREAPTFAGTLRAFIEGYVDFIRDNEPVVRLMVNENMEGGAVLEKKAREVIMSEEAPPRFLIEQIERAVEREEIRPVDPLQTILTVVSSCVFVFIAAPTVQMIRPRAAEDWEAFLEARKEHIFETIYYGLKKDDY